MTTAGRSPRAWARRRWVWRRPARPTPRVSDPLIDDPFARVFLDAAGDGMWNWFGNSDLPDEIAKVAPDVPLRMQGMRDYMASRTAFFDEFFIDATEAGVRQVVILAAGLDSRSWRLPWPDGVTVYELDQPKVLEFKSSTLRERGAQPTANLVSVPVDLRQDWPTALRQAGFDPAAPSAFTAEGLLPFLPSAAQDLLFERIQSLTAVGSQVAVEAPGPEFNNPDARDRQRATDAALPRAGGPAGRRGARLPRLRGAVVLRGTAPTWGSGCSSTAGMCRC